MASKVTKEMDILVSAKGTSTTKKGLSGIEKSLTSIVKVSAIAGTAFYSLKKAFDATVGDAIKYEKAVKQLETVLKSTGGAVGMTKKELIDLSNSLQSVTTYTGQSIIETENLLLTFTKIGKNVMPDAIETVLNMSTALGQDLKSSAIQVGKALNDPITGATALRRVGVSLTDQQMESIKTLQKQNKLFDAQKIIIDELAVEFGGAARGEAKTFDGTMTQINNSFSDMGREIGETLLPALKTFASYLKNIADTMTEANRSIEMFNTQLSITAFLKGLFESMAQGEHFMVAFSDALVRAAVAGKDTKKEIKDNKNDLDDLNNTISNDVILTYELYIQKLIEEKEEKQQIHEWNLQLIQDNIDLALQLGIVTDELKGIDKPVGKARDGFVTFTKAALVGMKQVDKNLNYNVKSTKKLSAAFIDSVSNNMDIAARGGIVSANIAKRSAQAQAVVNTAAAATKALSAYPPPFSFIAMAAQIAAGMAQIKIIESQRYASGGIVKGSGNQDNVPILATPGEVILNAAQQENLTKNMGVNIHIHGDFVGTEENADKLAEIIEERSGLGFNRIEVNA